MIVKYISKSPKETQELAKDLMKKLKNLTYKNAVVVALEGELGAGKTTFVQGMAKALKIKARVKSPTFSLMKSYKLKKKKKISKKKKNKVLCLLARMGEGGGLFVSLWRERANDPLQ